MKKIILLIFAITFVLLVLTGCTKPVVCGNNIIETGEQCDNSKCSVGSTCENCQCQTLPQPPTLPEE